MKRGTSEKGSKRYQRWEYNYYTGSKFNTSE